MVWLRTADRTGRTDDRRAEAASGFPAAHSPLKKVTHMMVHQRKTFEDGRNYAYQ